MKSFALSFATLLFLAGAARAGPTCKEARKGLFAQARISCARARRTALRAVGPVASVKSAELEEEKGRLVYSFDLQHPGRAGVEEVLVDARSGQVVSMVHESAQAEAAERH